MPSEYDLVGRYPCVKQILNDNEIRSIMLNPHLAIVDINMNERAMNALSIIPTNFQKLVMSVSIVKNNLLANSILRWRIVCNLVNDAFDNRAIGI